MRFVVKSNEMEDDLMKNGYSFSCCPQTEVA